jgi:hypothetical protein
MADLRLDPKHVGILLRTHAKYAVRGGSGITFVLIVVVLGLTVASILIDPLDKFRRELEKEHGMTVPRDQLVSRVVESLRNSPVLPYMLGTSDPNAPQVNFLLDLKPALLSVMFLILLFAEPFVVGFGAFNQLSGDIANRGLRYLLLRTSRLNIVVARLLGTFLFSALTTLFTMGVIVGYLAIRYGIYPIGDLVTWGLYGWAAVNLFSLPYLALCTWISTTVASPFGALAVAQLSIGVPIVLINYAQLMGSFGESGKLDWLDRLTPWGWKFDLLHPDVGTVATAVGVMLGFFALFFFLGARHFVKRDL